MWLDRSVLFNSHRCIRILLMSEKGLLAAASGLLAMMTLMK
jgi:hypothetical protein